jgi:hypothetical protein
VRCWCRIISWITITEPLGFSGLGKKVKHSKSSHSELNRTSYALYKLASYYVVTRIGCFSLF